MMGHLRTLALVSITVYIVYIVYFNLKQVHHFHKHQKIHSIHLRTNTVQEKTLRNNPANNNNNDIKYHEWGPEGIDIEAIIAFFQNRLFNYWGYQTEQHLKSKGKYRGRYVFSIQEASYLAVVAAANNDTAPHIYLPPKMVSIARAHGKRLLPEVLHMMDEAVSVDLLESHNRKKYPHLISALEDGSIPIIFQTSDWIWCANRTNEYVDLNGNNKIGSVPKLIFSKIDHCGYNFAIPDYKIVPFSKTDKQDREDKKNEYPSWEDKIPKAVWRGTMSNPGREEMVNRYQNQSHFDVLEVPYESTKGDYMPQEDFMKYRAVLDIDGRAWTDRFHRLLCQTSVVIKIQLKYTSYFDAALTPGVHYLAASLKNLTEVVEYATSDDNAEEMKGIIANANEWCADHVTYEELKKDTLAILNGYTEELYRANSSWTGTWNEHSPEFLTGEKAWNETSGWMLPPKWDEVLRKKMFHEKVDGLSTYDDLVVTGLPKEETTWTKRLFGE